jgi:hypothetical protein
MDHTGVNYVVTPGTNASTPAKAVDPNGKTGEQSWKQVWLISRKTELVAE